MTPILFLAVVFLLVKVRDARTRLAATEEETRSLWRALESLRRRLPAVPSEEAGAPAAPPVTKTASAPVLDVGDVGLPRVAEAPGQKPPESPPPTPPPETPPISTPHKAPTPRNAPPAATTPPDKPDKFDWENLVGVRLFSWIAGIALVLGGIFFLRYSVDQGWLSPPVRMAIGLIVGVSLLIACELRVARKYRVTANAMDAAGIALLFSTLFASHALWHLIGALPAFALMALVTAVAGLLSIRRDSPFIALLGLVGGFATPALLSTGEDRPIGLFSYLLLLNAGLAWIAYRKRWSVLTALSLAGTVLYQWAWVDRFLTPERMPLAAAIFLIFPTMAVLAWWFGDSDGEASNAVSSTFQLTVAVAALLPLLFALYGAVIPAYGRHFGILFGFLLLVDLGLFAIATARGPEQLHLFGAVSTVLVFVMYFARSWSPAAWPAMLGIVAAFVLLYLFAPMVAALLKRPLGDSGENATITATTLLFVFPALAAIEPRCAAPGLLFGALFSLLLIIGIAAATFDLGTVHLLAALFALAAAAVWSARHLEADRLLPALAIYAGFALFYLALPMLARARGRRLRPEGAAAVVCFLALGLLFFLALGPVAASALWGIALLLAILNLGALLQAAQGHHPLLALAGILLSWLVLGAWWSHVAIGTALGPAVAVVGLFAVLVTAGGLYARGVSGERSGSSSELDPAPWLALVGHLFLLFVAFRPDLSIPPGPLLSVLLLIDLAITVGALYSRQAGIALSAFAASHFVLIAWLGASAGAASGGVAIATALAVALLAAMALVVALRKLPAASTPDFAIATVVALIGAQLTAAFAGGTALAPGVGWLGLTHVALVAALLIIERSALLSAQTSLIAVPLSALAVILWRDRHFDHGWWAEELFFALPIYLLFVLHPFWPSRRSQDALSRDLAPTVAAIAFFVHARHALMAGGFAGIIGLLPIALAVVQSALVWRRVRLDPGGTRERGNLALVAGAALGWVTVAIPLQLEKQWITIGWALLAAALAWLYRRVEHRGLLVWIFCLGTATFARLVLNPAVLNYHPRTTTPILNWYLYTYLVSALSLLAAARWLRPLNDQLWGRRLSSMLGAAAAVLLFALLNIEIADFYSDGPALGFQFSAGLAQDLSYTIGWAMFAIGLLVAGIAVASRAARIAAIALLSVTVFKCFVHDLGRLGGLYRVGSFVGLAFCLALVAVTLQRFVLRRRPDSTSTPEELP